PLQDVRLSAVRQTTADADQIDTALCRPLRQLLRIARGFVPGNAGRPAGTVAGVEVHRLPTFLGRGSENSMDHSVSELGWPSLDPGDRRDAILPDDQRALLIRWIVGEIPRVGLPPFLPALRLLHEDAALQRLPPRIFAERHAEQLAVIEFLVRQGVQ